MWFITLISRFYLVQISFLLVLLHFPDNGIFLSAQLVQFRLSLTVVVVGCLFQFLLLKRQSLENNTAIKQFFAGLETVLRVTLYLQTMAFYVLLSIYKQWHWCAVAGARRLNKKVNRVFYRSWVQKSPTPRWCLIAQKNTAGEDARSSINKAQLRWRSFRKDWGTSRVTFTGHWRKIACCAHRIVYTVRR